MEKFRKIGIFGRSGKIVSGQMKNISGVWNLEENPHLVIVRIRKNPEKIGIFWRLPEFFRNRGILKTLKKGMLVSGLSVA